jgi:CDP-diacylglycerol--serine O-phosphatidyltransferase
VFIHYPHRKSSVPLRIIVPNMFTTVAMCCGLASIHYSLKRDWDHAVFAVILSAIFDALDGRAARLLKVSSPFGEVLDSLADFLSFGVAPALLLHQWMLKDQEVFGLIAVTAFVVCSAMRLARFTAATRPATGLTPAEQQRQMVLKSRFFTGLATPAAAAAVMVPVMLAYSRLLAGYTRPWLGMPMPTGAERLGEVDGGASPASVWVAVAVALYTLLIALWMVSRVPMFSFKKMRISRRAVVPLLLCAALVVAIGVRDMWVVVAGLALVYLCTAPLSVLSHRRVLRAPAPPGPTQRGAAGAGPEAARLAE